MKRVFGLNIKPRALPRPRVGGSGVYYPKAYQEWREECGWLVREHGKVRYSEPVAIQVGFGRDSIGVSIEPTEPVRPSGIRGDIDNYVKAILDVLQDVRVLDDDELVERIEAWFF